MSLATAFSVSANENFLALPPVLPAQPPSRYGEVSPGQNTNPFITPGEVETLHDNAFLGGVQPGDEVNERMNSFSGESETTDIINAYSQELEKTGETQSQENLFLGRQADGDASSAEFSSEYERLANKFWGNPKK